MKAPSRLSGISHKIMLGVGMLLLCTALVGLLLWSAQESLRSALNQTIKVEEPLSAVAHDLEIKAAEYCLKVLKYLATGDSSHRIRAQKDVEAFARTYAQFQALPLDPPTHSLGRNTNAKFQELVVVGTRMMQVHDSQQALFALIVRDRLQLDEIFEAMLRSARDEGPQAFGRLGLLTAIHNDVADASFWLAAHPRLGDPAYLERLSLNTARTRAGLARFQELPLSQEERRGIAEARRLFEATRQRVEDKLDLSRTMSRHERQFVQLRREIDDLLEEGVHQSARRRLNGAKETATARAERATMVVLILFPLIGVVGIGAGAMMIRQLKQPIRELTAGAESIGRGDLSHRVPVRGGDELAALAREFNRMASTLEASAAELTAANRELESFAYSVAHDLRSPVRAIGGFARVLAENHGRCLDGQGSRLLERIGANSQRMGLMIDRLLELSRVGRHPVHQTTIDMTALAEEVVGEVRARGECAATVTVRPLPAAWGDRRLVRQAMANLVSNAIKFSATREHSVVEIAGEAAGQENVYSVADNGVGFDMRYYGKLFGAFQRLHHADEFPGVGVGLAIVQRLVARNGGRVWAEGRPDAGATFHFTLPAAERSGSSVR